MTGEKLDPQEVHEGIIQELKQMDRFDTHDEVPKESLTAEEKNDTIDTRWVFRKKKESGKTFVRARLVVRGFKQKVEDLDSVYASTPSMTILRLLLLLALTLCWNIQTFDVCTAFMQAPLSGTHYVTPPFESRGDGNSVWKLKKAVNGLRTAPKDYQDFFSKQIETIGFKRMQADSSI